MLPIITKKEYSAICWENDPHMQKFTESETFEVVALKDGYAAISKPRIKKDFCFGYGMYLSATQEEIKQAEDLAESAKKWKNFYNENVKDILEKIKILESALNCEENGLFRDVKGYSRLCCIGIAQNFEDVPLSRFWRMLDSTYCTGLITPEKIIEANNWEKLGYRLAEREEVEALLEGEKRNLQAFQKRLVSYWKKYGDSKLNVWTYLVD